MSSQLISKSDGTEAAAPVDQVAEALVRTLSSDLKLARAASRTSSSASRTASGVGLSRPGSAAGTPPPAPVDPTELTLPFGPPSVSVQLTDRAHQQGVQEMRRVESLVFFKASKDFNDGVDAGTALGVTKGIEEGYKRAVAELVADPVRYYALLGDMKPF